MTDLEKILYLLQRGAITLEQVSPEYYEAATAAMNTDRQNTQKGE